MKLRCVSLIAVLMSIGAKTACAEEFYTLQDGVISFQKYGDSSLVKPEEWQMRLLPAGVPGTSKAWWGLITGKNVESVQKQLQSALAFESAYKKWAGSVDAGHPYTNALGPIAKLPGQRWRGERVLAGDLEIASARLMRLTAFAAPISDLSTKFKAGQPVPVKNFAVLTKEYFTNLHDVQWRLFELLARTENGAANVNLAPVIAKFSAAEKAAAALGLRDRPVIKIYAPLAPWTVAFGGGKFANYEATFSQLAGTIEFLPDGSVKTSSITLQYSEKVLNAALKPIPTHPQGFAMTKVEDSGSGRTIIYRPHTGNSPPCEMRLTLTSKDPGSGPAELTIHRIDLGPPFNFTSARTVQLVSQDTLATADAR